MQRFLFLFTSPLLIQGVSVIIWVIYILWLVSILFGETVVVFDHHYFDVQFRILGICLRRQRGNVLDVERVFKGEFTGYNHTKIPEVTLAVGVHEYVFGAQLLFPLTEVECVWLVQEINHWLGI